MQCRNEEERDLVPSRSSVFSVSFFLVGFTKQSHLLTSFLLKDLLSTEDPDHRDGGPILSYFLCKSRWKSNELKQRDAVVS